jgi:hypothetical protein
MSIAVAAPPSAFEVEATNSGGQSGEVPSEGNHPAVLIGLVDMLTHADTYQGKEYTNKKVLFCWELPGEFRSNGSPFIVAADYNMPPKLSGKSKLRSMIESWRGRPMEDAEKLNLAKMLGMGCLLNIGHGKSSLGNEFARILGISPMVKGMVPPKPFNGHFIWAAAMGSFNPPAWLPYLYGKPIEDIIADSLEVKGETIPRVTGPSLDNDDDIPF